MLLLTQIKRVGLYGGKMQSSQSIEWDRRLKRLFDEVDDYLEDKYGDLFPLHPNRMKRGNTSNKEMDGLFNIGASFSPGYGTELGRGYVVDLHLSTLTRVDFDRWILTRVDFDRVDFDRGWILNVSR